MLKDKERRLEMGHGHPDTSNLHRMSKFLGLVSSSELGDFYNALDIFVNPTLRAPVDGSYTAGDHALWEASLEMAGEGHGRRARTPCPNSTQSSCKPRTDASNNLNRTEAWQYALISLMKERMRDLAVVPPKSTLINEVEMVFSFVKEKESWDMSTPEKIEAAGKKKEEGNALFKACKYWRASEKYEKAPKYVELDTSFGEEEKKHVEFNPKDVKNWNGKCRI
eukprot:Gb_15022 [translate_table: standard]